jgi:hypothetical protein
MILPAELFADYADALASDPSPAPIILRTCAAGRLQTEPIAAPAKRRLSDETLSGLSGGRGLATFLASCKGAHAPTR